MPAESVVWWMYDCFWIGNPHWTLSGFRVYLRLYRHKWCNSRIIFATAEIAGINLSQREYDLVTTWDKEWFNWNYNFINPCVSARIR